MLSIYSTADTRRYDLGLVMSFRTRHLSRLCKQSLHLSGHRPWFARSLRLPPVRTRTWCLSCPRGLACNRSCGLHPALPFCSTSLCPWNRRSQAWQPWPSASPNTVFPISVCAETEPADKMASNGNNPSLASSFNVIFIERPLMTSSNRAALPKLPRGRDAGWGRLFCGILIGPRKA